VGHYKSWSQGARYFDGDGTIGTSDISNRPYKLSLSLFFVDQSAYQIANLKQFLNSHGVSTSNILKRSDGETYELAVSQYKSVRKALRRMIPFLCKKEVEARAALDYYEGGITGNQLLAVFKEEVEAGRRERRAHTVHLDIPYTRPQGDRLMRRIRKDRFRDALGRYRAKLTPDDFRDIRIKHFDQGKRICDLVREYPQYARETIRRVIGRGRGYIGVKGIGRVDTTDTTIREPKTAQKS
jgi:hypothetical protein